MTSPILDPSCSTGRPRAAIEQGAELGMNTAMAELNHDDAAQFETRTAYLRVPCCLFLILFDLVYKDLNYVVGILKEIFRLIYKNKIS